MVDALFESQGADEEGGSGVGPRPAERGRLLSLLLKEAEGPWAVP
jgi:hypothetical protein